MRIVLASEGTRGDLYPLLALGDALLRRGHEPLVCAPPDFEPVVRARGMDFRPVGVDVRAYLQAEAGAITGSAMRFLVALRSYANESVARQFAALPEATAGADLVVGAGVQMAAASAAELHGIPYRYVLYCPALLPSREHGPAILPFQPIPPWARRLAWWFALGPFTGLMQFLMNRERRALGLPRIRNAYRHLMGERPLLSADRALAHVPDDCPFEVEQTRSWHPLEGRPLPAKLESFLDAGPAPVYFGFGSMPDPDPAATTRTLLRAVERVGCRAILSSGWAELGDGPLPEGVIRIGDVDHARLFPRTAAVVHHGGAGTTTSAARSGVAQVVVPHVLDQFYWADRVRDLGLGCIGPRRSKLGAEALAEALRETLDNEALAERAQQVGARLRADAASEAHPAELLLRG